jgi:twinfilin-like protein
MAKAQLLMSAELERAFADAQGGKVRFVKVAIDGEAFVVSAVGAASSDVRRDAQTLVAEYLPGDQAAFVLFCLDVNVPALRWILLAFVPEGVNVRDKMLYSSSRESLKKQLGMNYFVGEFHATETVNYRLQFDVCTCVKDEGSRANRCHSYARVCAHHCRAT